MSSLIFFSAGESGSTLTRSSFSNSAFFCFRVGMGARAGPASAGLPRLIKTGATRKRKLRMRMGRSLETAYSTPVARRSQARVKFVSMMACK